MNVPRLAAHAVVSAAGTGIWLYGVNLPAGAPPLALQAVAVLPWLVAAVSFALAHHADTLTAQPRPPRDRPFYSPRAVDRVHPRELVRR